MFAGPVAAGLPVRHASVISPVGSHSHICPSEVSVECLAQHKRPDKAHRGPLACYEVERCPTYANSAVYILLEQHDHVQSATEIPSPRKAADEPQRVNINPADKKALRAEGWERGVQPRVEEGTRPGAGLAMPATYPVILTGRRTTNVTYSPSMFMRTCAERYLQPSFEGLLRPTGPDLAASSERDTPPSVERRRGS